MAIFPDGLKTYDWMTEYQKDMVDRARNIIVEIELFEDGDLHEDYPEIHLAAIDRLRLVKLAAWGHGPSCGCTYCT